MAKILLFDFDGTIADSFQDFLSIISTLTVKYDLPILTREEIQDLRSEEPRTLLKRLHIPFYKIPLLARDMKKLQRGNISKIKPINGLPEVLPGLRTQGYILGIVTSNAKENVKEFLRNNALEGFTYIYSDSSLFGKAATLQKFLKEHAVPPADILYIGDEIRDIQACKKVGIKIIAVTWGFNTKEGLVRYKPDFMVDTPEDLLRLLSGNKL